MKKHLFLLSLALMLAGGIRSQSYFFNYSRQLFGEPVTLYVWVESVNTTTGTVVINGVDTQTLTAPFTWHWDDNTTTTGYFPQSHTYSDLSHNYLVKVVSHYSADDTDTTEALIWFVPPQVSPVPLDTALKVFIPDHNISLSTRLYPLSTNITYFDDSFFEIIPRSTIEYILSIASTIQNDFANQNVYLFNNKFEQYVMRDSTFNGAYSIWFSDPVSFNSGDYFFTGTIGYSSLFHEMGHNVTLNSPAAFYYGGRIDGNANAIFSESMAQIYQHATGYELVNNYLSYGLQEDLMNEIRLGLISSMNIVRNSYDDYIDSGKIYQSWNDPTIPNDETYNTFMTIAYKFCEKAETTGMGYKEPLKRMMSVLQNFNPDWQQMYDPLHNSTGGATFRSTLMVSSMSFAFETDLRNEFRALNFPVNDSLYYAMYSLGTGLKPAVPVDGIVIYPNPASDYITLKNLAVTEDQIKVDFFDPAGRMIGSLNVGKDGKIDLSNIQLAKGLVLLRISNSNQVIMKKVMIR